MCYITFMGIFSKKLGIDLGTANTLVFLPGKGVVLNEPSVVAVSEQDNKILAIGVEAKNMIGKTPESIITYCPMKDGVIADYRVTEAMLHYYIKKTFNLAIGDRTAEEVKIRIGAAIPLEEELRATIKGRDFIQGLPRSAQVGTNEIVKAIDGELKQIIKAIKGVLQETPPELASDIMDYGIIMTGGSSQLRNFTDLVYRKTGVKAILAPDPIFCVAKGTGIALEHLNVYKKTILSKK